MRTVRETRASSPGVSALGLAFALGCNFGSPGGGSGSNGLGGDDSGDGGTGSASTTPPATSTSASGMSGAGTGDPTTDPSDPSNPSDPSVSGGEMDASASDSGMATTGAVSASSGTGDGSASAEGGSSSSGGVIGPEPYPACQASQPYCAGSDVCLILESGGNVLASWCSETGCDGPGDCPTPSTGNATKECVDSGDGFCVLSCAVDDDCPTGMDCYSVNGGSFYRCAWPS